MNTSKETQVLKNMSLFPKSTKLALLAVGVFALLLFLGVGVVVGSRMVSVSSPGNSHASSHSPVAKGASVPRISDVKVREVTNSTAVVRWRTNKAAYGQVDYGSSVSYEFASQLTERPATKHEIFLTDLEPGLLYHFQVRSRDPVGNLGFSENLTFQILPGKRGQVSICGWDGDSIERVDTICSTKDGWAKGKSWTDFCSAVWTETTSVPVEECIYKFSDVKARGSIATNETWQVTLGSNYTGWVDILVVESPSGTDKFSPAAEYAEDGQVTMDALSSAGKYTFRFRTADDSASWSDLLTITVRR